MSTTDSSDAEPVEIIDLSGDVPVRRFEVADATEPSTLGLLAQHGRRSPATTAADAAFARRRALVGLYLDERA